MEAAFEPTPQEWQQLKALMTRAFGRSRSERAALLEQELPDNPHLRAYALSMLRYYDNATGPLKLSNDDASNEEPFERRREAVRAGDSVGHYRVLRKLGEGGMGIVFLAEDERLGRQVALKFLSPVIRGSHISKEQLYAESRSVAALNHPAIVTLHDVFESDGELVTVMEYVEGEPLSARVRRGAESLGYALTLTRQLAEALAYAHGRGIIHCDLKPANIHVLPGGAPKILDFGLARALTASAPSDGRIAGTMGYIAPECLLGREPTAAADVYALGVIFYQLLTGETPFSTEDEGQLFFDTLTATPLPPSARVRGISPDVDGVALRCLAKHPRERLQPHELARAIVELLPAIDPTVPDSKRVLPASGVAAVAVPPAAGVWSKAASAAQTAAAAALIVTTLGFITSVSYNQPLGRVGEFATESVVDWAVWGVRSMLAVIGWSIFLGLGYLGLSGACRLAAATSGGARRIGERLHAVCRPIFGGSPQSVMLVASALLMIQIAALALTVWRFFDLLSAVDRFITSGSGSLAALAPTNRPEYSLLGQVAATQIAVFGMAWYWAARNARGVTHLEMRARLWGGAALTALSLIVFQTAPFRILYHNTAERVVFAGETCYAVASTRAEFVLFCPHRPPPRVHTVPADDGRLRRDGTVESIFSVSAQ